jgi:hypothetical protein
MGVALGRTTTGKVLVGAMPRVGAGVSVSKNEGGSVAGGGLGFEGLQAARATQTIMRISKRFIVTPFEPMPGRNLKEEHRA